jgi:predicted ATPase/DNA-binding CsgD family transcriptional regulator
MIPPDPTFTAERGHVRSLCSRILVMTEPLSSMPSSTRLEPPGAPARRVPRLRSILIGRETELAHIDQMLARDDVFLLTLTGPGGVGKTRLAIEAGTRVAPLFRDGVVYVALDSTHSAELARKTIGDALGLSNPGIDNAFDQNVAYLRTRQLLLILDSFEHVLDAGPDVVRMLQECDGVKVLITSRTRLHLSIEHDLPVPPLSVPAAVELFVTRARAVTPTFALDVNNAADIAAICARLDRLPLAVELAAARAPMFSPADLLARLEPVLDLLTTGARDQPDRHRTMRNAIGWSYDLLDPVDQQLLRRLAVFEQSFSLDLAANVAGDGALLDGMLSLIDKSLIHLVEDPGNVEPRYRMLHTVREFALERLAERDENDEIHRRHAQTVSRLVTDRSERIWIGEATEILGRFDRELGNIRSALRWAATAGEIEIEIELAGGMVNYWVVRGHLREGFDVLTSIRERGGKLDIATLARISSGIGWIACLKGEFSLAYDMGIESRAIARQHGHQLFEAQALQLLTLVTIETGENTAAFSWAEQALTLFRHIEDQITAGSQYVSAVLSMMGQIALAQGNLSQASMYLEDEFLRQRGWGLTWRVGETLRQLGDIAAARGDADGALQRYRDSIALSRDHGDRFLLAGALVAMAILEAGRGNAIRAVRLLGAAETLTEQIGSSVDRWEGPRYDTVIEQLRTELGADAFAEAWEAGAALSFDELLSETLADPAPSAQARPVSLDAAGVQLTMRELEVLQLLAEGLSDREIGEALSISPRTASGHVANLLGKLNVTSRTAAAAYAVRLQMSRPESLEHSPENDSLLPT